MQQLTLSVSEAFEHDPGCKRQVRMPVGVIAEAEFDGVDRRYRYKLIQRWGAGPMVAWCMMNPSGASEFVNDSTVDKCGRFARRWGFGGQYIANACAYRATDRMRLLEVGDPVGPRNHAAILEMAADAKLIVVAHGRLPGKLQRHAHAMVELLRDHGYALHVLRLTEDGTPVHPLARGAGFIPLDTQPQLWTRT